jgi:hypothetical protein
MKILPIISILLFFLSCNDKNTKTIEKIDNSKNLEIPSTENNIKPDGSEFKDYQNEVMEEEDILFNGKLKRYFTLKEFETVFGKPDSIKLMSEEEPCSYIFENEDGSKNMEDKYLYKNGSRFENTKEKVAVDEFRFVKNNFILFRGIKLNSSTSINELHKIFPNAMKGMRTIDVYGEGKLQVIRLREDENNVSDGHINLFIKNDKLYFMHWWFPC